MKQLEKINLADAKQLLKDVRSYADMTKKLGNRGRGLFMKTLLGTQSFTIEYFPALGKQAAWDQAQNVFQKSFWVTPKQEDVIFVENTKIKGGMKVYSDDNMVDLSYKKVENLMQK